MTDDTATAEKALENAKQADLAIKKALAARYGSSSENALPTLSGIPFRNTRIFEQLKSGSTLTSLFDLLLENGTFDFNFESVPWQDTDGETRALTINRASKTDMWPMGTHFWVRDNAIIANRLLNLDYDSFPFPLDWQSKGKEILLSTLTIISSATQLKRFKDIISGEKDHAVPLHWPHIFLDIESNLNAAKDEPWMHKQDAWQIISHYTHDALEKGHITPSDLTAKHREFLSMACPFLIATDHIHCPNGGSWEEIDAKRTSVLAWETALLKKISTSEHFPHPEATILHEKAQAELLRRLPAECPDYPTDSPLHRNADAALIYLLILDVIDWSTHPEKLEQLIANIETLVGDHGIKRYQGDSYQGLNYYSNAITTTLTALYDSPSGDSSGLDQFTKRGEIVPPGHEAQWTHFTWQLSHALGTLAKKTGLEHLTKKLKQKQTTYFHRGLALITGENELTLSPGDKNDNNNNFIQTTPLPPYRLPECYNTHQTAPNDPNNRTHTNIHYPSLHTPLYWSIAESLTAFNTQAQTKH